MPLSGFLRAVVVLWLIFQAANVSAAPKVDFALEIQPILAKHCFKCHGPDKAEGGLSLSTEAGAFAELESGEHALIRGEPEKGVLIERVRSDDEFERMPPEGKPLSAAQIALIENWIEQGMEWSKPWAFTDVERPPVPEVKQKDWVATPIDAFILAQLEAKGLAPSPPAEKRDWLRRSTYDLTGLPPTPDEMADFLADGSPAAYEKVIDRLLASDRYGERWARHWLDVVRFAETNSFERDGNKPHAFRYRDYVIRAFNEDKPYDQFIREQIAGDELPNPTADSITATGYYRLGLWDDEPADRQLAMYDGFDDLVTTTGQAFLGLTINCARCHDHKLDPIPQKDYYGMVAFFRNITPMGNGGGNIEREVFPAGDRESHDAKLRELQQNQNEVQAAIGKLEAEFAASAAGQVAMTDLDDLTFKFYRDTWNALPNFDEIKAEEEGKLPGGLFTLSPATRNSAIGFVFEGVLIVPAAGEYEFHLDSDDGSRLLLAGKEILKYDGIHGLGGEKSVKLQLAQGRTPIRLEYFQNQGGLGLAVAWSGPGFTRRTLAETESTDNSARIAEEIKRSGKKILGEEKFAAYQEAVRELARLKSVDLSPVRVLCITERGRDAPETFVLQRGNPQAEGEKVGPRFPHVLDESQPEIEPLPAGVNSSGRRLVLANWLASPENKLTARVMMNRIWQHHFGRGIVRSPNNFGSLGTPPTHPELLDWLAVELMEGGWKLKRIHKLIMLSNVYRQSSRPGEKALEIDPVNDLFSHFDMRRLSAEEVRDSLLAANGRINFKMYGPGFYPEISKEVLAGQSKPGDGWGNSSPEERSRRSIYIHVKRSLITPILESFDFPDTDSSCEARFTTTQPTQALGMLNSKFLNDQAELFSQRLIADAGEQPEKQVARAVELAFSRPADKEEIAAGVELMQTLQEKYKLTPAQSLKYYCLSVCNQNEFLYLD